MKSKEYFIWLRELTFDESIMFATILEKGVEYQRKPGKIGIRLTSNTIPLIKKKLRTISRIEKHILMDFIISIQTSNACGIIDLPKYIVDFLCGFNGRVLIRYRII